MLLHCSNELQYSISLLLHHNDSCRHTQYHISVPLILVLLLHRVRFYSKWRPPLISIGHNISLDKYKGKYGFSKWWSQVLRSRSRDRSKGCDCTPLQLDCTCAVSSLSSPASQCGFCWNHCFGMAPETYRKTLLLIIPFSTFPPTFLLKQSHCRVGAPGNMMCHHS